MEEEIDFLECVWDKFILVETSGKGKLSRQVETSEPIQTPGAPIQYRSIRSFLDDDEYDSENTDANEGEESLSNTKRKRIGSPPPICNENINLAEQAQMPSALEHSSADLLQPCENTSLGGTSHVSSKPDSMSNKQVAFKSVKSTPPIA